MALFKCKMCGGNLEVTSRMTVAECDYCGTTQTLPSSRDEGVQNLFNRANHLRLKCDFDKAEQLYEKILQNNDTEAEAHWGIVLCKYGIEYVEDPKTYKRIPTCHRTSYNAVTADADYLAAIEHADMTQKAVYEAEAKAIEEIQKNILSIVKNETPYDVFLCYKETDEDGKRTIDSAITNDIYHQLTQEGLKVFYAAITLEDKLGQEYEPYIFAALNSARVMLVIGTKPQYFSAVWVKNEWSRFLQLMRVDRSKLLIPCYKDMDAYDLPEEFAHLQAQDMSKIGFINDVVRGIKKVAVKGEPESTAKKKKEVAGRGANVAPLLKRVFMFLEDEDWDSADEYCEKVLDMDPENAQAYLGKLMAKLEVTELDELKKCDEPFDDELNYQKIMRFGDAELKNTLAGFNKHIEDRIEDERLQGIYLEANEIIADDKSERAYKEAAEVFKTILGYKDSDALYRMCLESAEESEKLAERCDILYKEYKVAVRNEKSNINKKREANEKLSSFNTVRNDLTNLRGNWKNIEEELSSYTEKLKSLQSEIASLNQERSNLGLFAGKRKKEIAERIVFLEGEQRTLTSEITSTQNKKQGYSVISEIDNAIDSIMQQIEDQKKIIEELSSVRSSYAIRDELRTYEIGKKYLQEYDAFINMKEGDYVTFGTYKQDSDVSGRCDAIEWIVLEVKDKKALVISKYGLDCMPYNTTCANVTWETCTLRKWLNNEFINTAFSEDERAMIPTVTVSADRNPLYETNPGHDTQDQVFLLSIVEAYKYFESDSERQCKPTKYAVSKGAYVEFSTRASMWRLRSPGDYETSAAYVRGGGGVHEYGDSISNVHCAVRPALWIDLDS